MKTEQATHYIPEESVEHTFSHNGFEMTIDVGNKDEFSDGLTALPTDDDSESFRMDTALYNYSEADLTDRQWDFITTGVRDAIHLNPRGERWVDTTIVLTEVSGIEELIKEVYMEDYAKLVVEEALEKL